jgi:hypothetical protein
VPRCSCGLNSTLDRIAAILAKEYCAQDGTAWLPSSSPCGPAIEGFRQYGKSDLPSILRKEASLEEQDGC